MDMDWVRLAKAVRQAREAAGLTQVELAERAGVSEGSVQNLESGVDRTRIPPSLQKVEKALGWAPGSGYSVLRDAASPVTVEPIGSGTVIARIPETELHDAITRSAIAVSDTLTAREIRELSQKVVEDLKQRGVI